MRTIRRPYFWYYYLDEESFIVKVKALKKPSSGQPRGRWIVLEHKDSGWQMPAFPEIGWKRLSELKYIGRTEV